MCGRFEKPRSLRDGQLKFNAGMAGIAIRSAAKFFKESSKPPLKNPHAMRGGFYDHRQTGATPRMEFSRRLVMSFAAS